MSLSSGCKFLVSLCECYLLCVCNNKLKVQGVPFQVNFVFPIGTVFVILCCKLHTLKSISNLYISNVELNRLVYIFI